ncbi:hypothetical protein PL887_01620 [Bifidobacterium adolescentis]|nr:hypothetical protein [Bifidobacterium adolescentis]
MNNQYAVSIRHIYTMPDETFNGYELVLWGWDVIENTWLFRATRDYPISKYSNDLLDGSEAFVYGVIMQARLLDHIIDHCRSMLGYSGSMPSEVPNQSEGAK